jgi:hypothetical protein
MKRALIVTAALIGVFGFASVSEAQVFIRAPFVRVAVGDGVAVRAPFVNLWVPSGDPYYGPMYGPRVMYMPPPGVQQYPQQQYPQQQLPQQQFPPAPQPVSPQQTPPNPPQPQPKLIKDDAPPQAAQPVQAPTLDAFAKTFQPKAGTYEVTILNPVSKQPTPVRFILPEGTPRRVHVTRDSIEWVYGLRQWVRIEFDRDGVQVTAR